jgi:hypothetical protein
VDVVTIDPLELAAAHERDAGPAPSPTTTAAISTRATPHELKIAPAVAFQASCGPAIDWAGVAYYKAARGLVAFARVRRLM